MVNARILYIEDMHMAKMEINKVGVDAGALPWIGPKSVHIKIKLENISAYAANILKQEMLGKGGDAAVNRGVANFTVQNSDILLMGTYSQYNRLLAKLKLQSGSLRGIADEIRGVLEVFYKGKPDFFECGKYKLPIGKKTYIMGILNITPDSFSDGGKYIDCGLAVKRALEMIDEGADIIDVGGESTRPGHEPVDAQEEINRVIPVIERLSDEIDKPISIDTSKALVAKAALKAGASIINDVWGLHKDISLAEIAAGSGAGIVMMHNRDDKDYVDLMADIIRFLRESVQIAERAGISRSRMVIDPGIGFGKKTEHNLEIMNRLRELKTLNIPLLLGTSRKSFIGNTLDLSVDERVEGTAATVALGIAYGVDIIRVHDIKEMTKVARMTDAIVHR